MRIWLVEDDTLQAKSIHAVLHSGFPDAEIVPIKTELEFVEKLSVAVHAPPSVIVLDMMLPYTSVRIGPAGEPVVSSPPEDYESSGGFYRAGARCIERMKQLEWSPGIPVILFTVLTTGDLAAENLAEKKNVTYLSKREEPKQLVKLVKTCVTRPWGNTPD